MTKIKKVIKGNVVLTVAIIAAFVTGFIIPPDSNYLGYFDMRTLSCLFCTLAVICALKGVEVMGRDISILSTNEASQNPVIRSIVSADNKSDIDVTSAVVAFTLKPHKVFLFDHESEERVSFETV